MISASSLLRKAQATLAGLKLPKTPDGTDLIEHRWKKDFPATILRWRGYTVYLDYKFRNIPQDFEESLTVTCHDSFEGMIIYAERSKYTKRVSISWPTSRNPDPMPASLKDEASIKRAFKLMNAVADKVVRANR